MRSFILFITLLLSLNSSGLPAQETIVRISQQNDLQINPHEEAETFTLLLDRFEYRDGEYLPFDFSALAQLENTTTLNILYKGNDYYPPIWESLLTLPKMPSVKKFKYEPEFAWFIDTVPKGGRRVLWELLREKFPNLGSLSLRMRLGKALFEQPDPEDEITKLAEYFPELEEFYARRFATMEENFNGMDLMQNLRILDLNENVLFRQGQRIDFIFSLTKLEKLNLGHPRAVFGPYTDAVIFNYVPDDFFDRATFANLTHLDLSGLNLPTLNLKTFAPQLAELNLCASVIARAHLEDLVGNSSLRSLDLSQIKFSKEQLEQFSKIVLSELQELNFSHSNVRKVPFATLTPNLKTLDLSFTNISAGDFKEIEKLTDLKILNLKGIKQTNANKISELRLLLPNCQIID